MWKKEIIKKKLTQMCCQVTLRSRDVIQSDQQFIDKVFCVNVWALNRQRHVVSKDV